MEFLTMLIDCKFYSKLYDSQYKLNYKDNMWLPFIIIQQLTKHVNINNQYNLKVYEELIENIIFFSNRQIPFKLYKDESSNFRKIILKTNKIIMVKNLYY